MEKQISNSHTQKSKHFSYTSANQVFFEHKGREKSLRPSTKLILPVVQGLFSQKKEIL
jgi:hypothetical protein